MNKNLKIGIIISSAAVPLLLLLGSYPGIATSQVQPPPTPEEERAIFIDFSIAPETEPIVVERGRTVSVPLKVQAPNDAEKTLKIRLAAERGNIDPEEFNAALSHATVVLNKLDVVSGKVKDLGHNIGERAAGVLTLTAPAGMEPGNYTFTIEAEQEADGKLADALVAGKIVTIQVK